MVRLGYIHANRLYWTASEANRAVEYTLKHGATTFASTVNVDTGLTSVKRAWVNVATTTDIHARVTATSGGTITIYTGTSTSVTVWWFAVGT